jgi:hypothetical protein
MARCACYGNEYSRPITARPDRRTHDDDSLVCAHGIVDYIGQRQDARRFKCVCTGNIAALVPDQLSYDSLVEKPLRSVNRVSRARRGVRLVASGQLPIPY